MHYKNGREAKNGDKVVCLSTMWKGGPTAETMTLKGAPVVGVLYDAEAGNDHCNGKLAQISPSDACPDLANCLHLDDVAKALPDPVPDTSKPSAA